MVNKIPVRFREPRAKVVAVAQRLPSYTYEGPLTDNVLTAIGRTCEHCGCFASGWPVSEWLDWENHRGRHGLCARGDLTIGGGITDPEFEMLDEDSDEDSDEHQRRDLDAYGDESGTYYTAPEDCLGCGDRGECRMPQDGWDFSVEWADEMPANDVMHQPGKCLCIAVVRTALDAMALARAKQGTAYAWHVVDGVPEDEPLMLAGNYDLPSAPEVEHIPACLP